MSFLFRQIFSCGEIVKFYFQNLLSCNHSCNLLDADWEFFPNKKVAQQPFILISNRTEVILKSMNQSNTCAKIMRDEFWSYFWILIFALVEILYVSTIFYFCFEKPEINRLSILKKWYCTTRQICNLLISNFKIEILHREPNVCMNLKKTVTIIVSW